jgi:hypothetical protein
MPYHERLSTPSGLHELAEATPFFVIFVYINNIFSFLTSAFLF